ncbi:hypothetical protein conserved [Entamoeba histolytica]|uniref:PPM-type phosphatase domain-containing protein n=1 Tax=Entamoeba histolytica TaxID=5759 RepID=A0A175K136_ENTHI|nr:hypothetical protein conserved [Entamoeba histolytica]
MVEQPAPSNNRNNQQQLSFIQKHPLAACLIVVFIAYSCYGIYSTIYPPTNGYKSAYMDNEHIYFNVSLIHQSQEHHLLSKDVEYKNIDSLSEPISIPSNYLSYIKSNQSIIMKVVVKPLTKYNNQSMTFKSPILRTFKPIPQTHNLINENNITTTTNELNFTLGCIPYFEISFMKQIVDPHNIPPECGIVHYNGIKKRIAPIIFHNTFWLIKDYYTPINDTIQNLNISLKITSISYFKMIMIHSLGHSFSIHQHMGTMVHDEIDEFKRVFMETNIILLVITTIVSTLHTIFDFLAYKNDIQPSKRYEIGISQTIGKNDRMQDTANVLGELFPNIDIIGIFDGHNGEEAARYCLISMKNEFNCLNPKDCEHQLPQIFESIHNNISSQTISGTTASICIIRSDDVVLAHVGDSPIYFYENGHLTRMTQNHSATFEKERIIASGGKVINIKGVDRVNGQINLSRSLGDKLLQPPLTYKPDISIHSLSMKYIVIVTDGVTDSLSFVLFFLNLIVIISFFYRR